MRSTTMLMGALFVAMGVFCIANYGVAFMSLAFVIGIVMIVFGVGHTVVYVIGRGDNRKDNNSWICVDAIVTLILGALTLCDQMEAEVAVVQVFSMWILFSGVMRAVMATHINYVEKKSNFLWTMGTGLACILSGFMGFLNALIFDTTVPVILGIFFIVQGIASLELGFHMPHLKYHLKEREQRRLNEKI